MIPQRLFSLLVLFQFYGMCSSEYDAEVLILGAGMAGIAAAEILDNSGIKNFILIEGGDRIGGRVKSMKFHGTTIELGANWIQGVHNNPLTNLAKKYGLKGNIETQEFVIRNSTGANTTDAGNKKLYKKSLDIMESIRQERKRNKEEDISYRVGLRLAGWQPTSPEQMVVEYNMADFEYAVPPKYISLRTEMNTNTSINATDGKQMFITDQRGFCYLIDRIADGFMTRNDSRLKLNSRVKTIYYDDKGARVLTEDGRNFTAKRVLVTFSIGVLKSNSVNFSPSLPSWKMEQIFKLNMVIYTKIFIKFPFKFWDDNEYIYYASKRRGYFPIWQNLEADSRLPKGTNILLITVTQEEAKRIEFQDDKLTRQEIMTVLKGVYGSDIPEMIDMYAPKWGLDDLYLGSWANVPIGMSSSDYESLQKPVQSLYFAGEATHELYNGYLHGAYFSGQRAAAQIVRSLRSDTSNCR
ncbi:polyamine oxidase 1 [Exaiptasia diaphana]|uniref:Amine oxidase n=1 Tax=Exaiptasia diaphana TaxID=2652724 RepID=A0A913WVI6_EXADI|nr:polyamine oxidase 1 [Exaiptasia diaphana]KXJ17565.1 Polyamine oxidase [Exaiptasia diaphana]